MSGISPSVALTHCLWCHLLHWSVCVQEKKVPDLYFKCYAICHFHSTLGTAHFSLSYRNWMIVGFSPHELHHRKQTPPKCEMSPKAIASSPAAVALCWMPAFPPQMSLPASTVVSIPMASPFVCPPHHIGAALRWDRSAFWVLFSPPLVCCSRARGAINKRCAFMARSCVAQQGVTHAARPVLHPARRR